MGTSHQSPVRRASATIPAASTTATSHSATVSEAINEPPRDAPGEDLVWLALHSRES